MLETRLRIVSRNKAIGIGWFISAHVFNIFFGIRDAGTS